MRIHPHGGRDAATAVEAAFILPVTFFLLFGLVIGAMGVFRYEEVAALARQATRYASTHGHQYRKDAGLPVGTSADWQADIYKNAISPNLVSLDPSLLSYSGDPANSGKFWPDVINQPGKPDNWPGSQVTVTVSYKWFPELYIVGPLNLTSTSSMPITN
jgi:Flp pilus assembly protein TadG